MDRRARLISLEVRHQVLSEKMVSAEEVMAMVTGLLQILRKHVKDQETLKAIGGDIHQLLPDEEYTG